VIPPLVNTFIAFFKDTSLVLIIGIFDLLTTPKTAIIDPGWQQFSVEVYIFVAVIYFASVLRCPARAGVSIRRQGRESDKFAPTSLHLEPHGSSSAHGRRSAWQRAGAKSPTPSFEKQGEILSIFQRDFFDREYGSSIPARSAKQSFDLRLNAHRARNARRIRDISHVGWRLRAPKIDNLGENSRKVSGHNLKYSRFRRLSLETSFDRHCVRGAAAPSSRSSSANAHCLPR
jgi:hypothetical protein